MQRLPVAIEDALTAWTAAIHPDATALWANQDGHRPKPPFMLLDIIAGPQSMGAAEERYTQTDTYTYGIRKQATLNIQVVADNALVRAAAIETALALPSRQSILQAAGIAAHQATGLRDISTLLDTAHEPRATIDIVISYPDPVDDTPGEIHSVRVIGSADDITVDKTIDIEEE
jgi:hypothetical protein